MQAIYSVTVETRLRRVSRDWIKSRVLNVNCLMMQERSLFTYLIVEMKFRDFIYMFKVEKCVFYAYYD